MYRVRFFKDRNGRQPVVEYLKDLCSRSDKSSRIQAQKVQVYINILERMGTAAGEPYVKHLEGDIWELRPRRDRILFVAWYNNEYVLLHVFMKKTQKTPKKEIEQAKREFQYLIESEGQA